MGQRLPQSKCEYKSIIVIKMAGLYTYFVSEEGNPRRGGGVKPTCANQ